MISCFSFVCFANQIKITENGFQIKKH